MTKVIRESTSRDCCVGKSTFAGLVGGIVGALAMDQFTRVWNRLVPDSKQRRGAPPLPYSRQEWDSTSRTAAKVGQRILGRRLTPQETRIGAQTVHFGVAATAGAGIAVALPKSRLTVTSGAIFGLLLWFFGEELAMTALQINDPPKAYTIAMHLNSLGEHLAYGIAASLTARALIAMF